MANVTHIVKQMPRRSITLTEKATDDPNNRPGEQQALSVEAGVVTQAAPRQLYTVTTPLVAFLAPMATMDPSPVTVTAHPKHPPDPTMTVVGFPHTEPAQR